MPSRRASLARRHGPEPGAPAEHLGKGAVVAGYRIRRELDHPRGTYVAYEASKGSRGDGVVFKLVDERLSRDERFSVSLRYSLRRQSALSHPALLPVLDGGRTEQGLYVVTAPVAGPTLAQVLEAEGRRLEQGGLKPPRAMHVLEQVAAALEAAHAAELVHGCLQTQCIRLGRRDAAFVDDVGLSRLEAGEDPLIGPALLYGAPEQFDGEPATPRSDVYGLAAVAYECLTGTVPYWHGAVSHDGKPPLPMARHSRDLPPELDEPFARALSAAPEDRQASVSELIRELTGPLLLWSCEATPVKAAPRPDGRRQRSSARRTAAKRDGVPAGFDPETVWNDRQRAAAAAAATGGVVTGDRVRPVERSGSTRYRRPLVAGGAVLAVALAAVALATLLQDSADAPPASPSVVRSGPLELTAPAGWQNRTAGWELAALDFTEEPITLAPPGGAAGPSLVAGSVAAQGPTFVPRPVVATLQEALPRPDLVRLRGARALRYSGLQPRGSGTTMTLYSIPTSSDVAIISCSAPGSGSAVAVARQLDRCERVAATLELRGAQPVELVFSARYGQVLTDTLTRLNAARARERENLRRRGRQPEAARALALAYAEAGRTLATTDPPSDVALHASIRRAFRRTRQAYAGLAAAARRNDRAAYRRASQSAEDGERDIQTALEALNTLGYTAR